MFIEKQMELMSAMKQSNYELFDNDAEDAYDTLERIFSAFVEYANCVIRMQVMIPIWRNRYDGEELRDKVQDIDQARHVYHESAISSLKQLNRLCSIYGLSGLRRIPPPLSASVGGRMNPLQYDLFL